MWWWFINCFECVQQHSGSTAKSEALSREKLSVLVALRGIYGYTGWQVCMNIKVHKIQQNAGIFNISKNYEKLDQIKTQNIIYIHI